MKKLFSMMLIMASMMCAFSSCSEDEIYVPQDVAFTLDYTFAESGSMTRATGEEVYSSFYDKYIKTKQLTPTTYSLTFTNKETGAVATINGRWDKKDAIRLPEGTYNVNGVSIPKELDFKEWSDSVYLTFDEVISLKKDDTHLRLTAKYDSYLLMFDAENTSNVACKNTGATSSTKKGVPYDDKLYWIFLQKACRDNKSHSYYLVITRNDGQKSEIKLVDIPFEKGKYYYFNDMTNSFDIPKMESGN